MAKDIVVIGGGPAGIEAARAVASGGGKVTLISDLPIGGRAGWDSLLPSKVWLTTADRFGKAGELAELGFTALDGQTINPASVLARLAKIKESWNAQERASLLAQGVEIIEGTATFIAPDSAEIVTGEKHEIRRADAFIVATGSVPWFPDGLKPDGKRVLAPRFVSHLEKLPRSAVVIGGGPTGCEFTYLFNRLGVSVTWVVDSFGVLPMFHVDAGEALTRALVTQGVNHMPDMAALEIERDADGIRVVLDDGRRIEADIAFVAIGRRPDWSKLNLPAAGLDPTDGIVAVDSYGRTDNPNIYLVGDADGGMMVANKAMAQARIAARHALGLDPPPFDPQQVILAVYTDPQVAQIGQVEGVGILSRRVTYEVGLKAHLDGATSGFVELTYGEIGRQLTGGLAVGPHAADVLAPVAVGVNLGATVDRMADIYVAHPTITELAFLAVRA